MHKPFHSAIEKKLKSIQVSDLMSHEPITVDEDISLQSVAHILTKFRISGLPVVDSAGCLKGIITATDLLNRIRKILADIEDKKDPSQEFQIRVKEVMTQPVVAIAEGQSLYEAAKIMSEKNIHTLPVSRGGKMIGVIGRRDIIHVVYGLQ